MDRLDETAMAEEIPALVAYSLIEMLHRVEGALDRQWALGQPGRRLDYVQRCFTDGRDYGVD